MLVSLLQLIRIKDWLKNIIIFLPVIFSGNLSNYDKYPELILVFFIFCFSASFIYILNDIVDIKEDRLHSFKKKRKPLANDKLSIKLAIYLLIIFLLLILFLLLFLNSIIYHVIIYISLNLVYSFFIKKIPVIDLICLSFGYIIRLDAGSVAIDVKSSFLIIMTIFSLSFFITSIKRLVEFIYQNKKRISLNFYSSRILNLFIYLSSIAFLISCLLFFLQKNLYLLTIFPILVFFLFRYYKLAINEQRGEFPIDLVFKDKILFFICSGFFILILFLNF